MPRYLTVGCLGTLHWLVLDQLLKLALSTFEVGFNQSILLHVLLFSLIESFEVCPAVGLSLHGCHFTHEKSQLVGSMLQEPLVTLITRLARVMSAFAEFVDRREVDFGRSEAGGVVKS